MFSRARHGCPQGHSWASLRVPIQNNSARFEQAKSVALETSEPEAVSSLEIMGSNSNHRRARQSSFEFELPFRSRKYRRARQSSFEFERSAAWGKALSNSFEFEPMPID